MNEVSILERRRGKGNVVVSYKIKNMSDGSVIDKLADALENDVREGCCRVINADLLSDGSFRAKSGCSIKTVKNGTAIGEFPDDYVGKEFVGFCHRVRTAVAQNRLDIEFADLPLLRLIELVNGNVESHVRRMLFSIQPFTLRKFEDDDTACLLYMGFGVYLVIRLEVVNGQDFIHVSFQEGSLGCQGRPDDLCAVIPDKISPSGLYEDRLACSFIAHYGFIRQEFYLFLKDSHIRDDLALEIRDCMDIQRHYIVRNRWDRIREMYYTQLHNVVDYPLLKNTGTPFIDYGGLDVGNVSLVIECFNKFGDRYERFILLEVMDVLLASATQSGLVELKYGLLEYYKEVETPGVLFEQVMYLCDKAEKEGID